jgi:hypothetical protein
VGSGDGVPVLVGSGVPSGVVGAVVAVASGVCVGATVALGDAVAVGDGVAVAVAVGEGVGVFVASLELKAPPLTMTAFV